MYAGFKFKLMIRDFTDKLSEIHSAMTSACNSASHLIYSPWNSSIQRMRWADILWCFVIGFLFIYLFFIYQNVVFRTDYLSQIQWRILCVINNLSLDINFMCVEKINIFKNLEKKSVRYYEKHALSNYQASLFCLILKMHTLWLLMELLFRTSSLERVRLQHPQ